MITRPLWILAACLGFSFTSCRDRGDPGAAGGSQAMSVAVARPVKKVVAPTDTFTGRFAAVDEVEVRSRVSGYLDSAHFQEGQLVEKGDLLFRIDPRLFDAAMASAEAQVKQAEARLALAESNLGRAGALVKKGAMSKEEFDVRTSEVAQADANRLTAVAARRTAELDREFADIHAPIEGIAGRYIMTPGNFISGGNASATLLTTIVPHDPIDCYFEVDERRVLRFTRMFFEGKTDGRGGERPEVEIAVSDSNTFEFKGKIDFSENQLDKETATIQIRARVENKNRFLTPGLFARVRLPIGRPTEALLVRDSALGFDQSRRFAWVVGADNTVEHRFVETGPLQEGMRVVEKGLTSEERIAVSGIQLLRPGAPVAPSEVPMDPNESPAPLAE